MNEIFTPPAFFLCSLESLPLPLLLLHLPLLLLLLLLHSRDKARAFEGRKGFAKSTQARRQTLLPIHLRFSAVESHRGTTVAYCRAIHGRDYWGSSLNRPRRRRRYVNLFERAERAR